MRCFSFFLVTLFLSAISAASAECSVCDEVIEIDSARASCFMENHESIAKSVAAAPNGRLAIDLDACALGGEKLASRGGISVMPRLKGSTAIEEQPLKPTKSVYLLDVASVFCLRALIASHTGPLDPLATFDLFEQCNP